MKITLVSLAIAAFIAMASGCAVDPAAVTVPVQPSVDIGRFMGPWYVIANIPTSTERGAHNAMESYALNPDGTIATTFTFNQDRFDGPVSRHTPLGFVVPGTNNAIWGMQFVWPIKAEYVIAYVDDAYTQTIIARSARDYVWILARTRHLDDADYAALVERVKAMGYDTSKLVRVPQAP